MKLITTSIIDFANAFYISFSFKFKNNEKLLLRLVQNGMFRLSNSPLRQAKNVSCKPITLPKLESN
jgi:hypothetical protein